MTRILALLALLVALCVSAAPSQPAHFVTWREGLHSSVIHEGAPVGETAIRLNGVWAPDRVWKKFIDDTLAASGRKPEVF